MSTPIWGCCWPINRANSRSTPTPLAPSFAPSIGLLWRLGSDSSSAVGRESQWANKSMRSGLSAPKRPMILVMGPKPSRLVCCSIIESAPWRLSSLTSHFPHSSWAWELPIRGPKATCRATLLKALSGLKTGAEISGADEGCFCRSVAPWEQLQAETIINIPALYIAIWAFFITTKLQKNPKNAQKHVRNLSFFQNIV